MLGCHANGAPLPGRPAPEQASASSEPKELSSAPCLAQWRTACREECHRPPAPAPYSPGCTGRYASGQGDHGDPGRRPPRGIRIQAGLSRRQAPGVRHRAGRIHNAGSPLNGASHAGFGQRRPPVRTHSVSFRDPKPRHWLRAAEFTRHAKHGEPDVLRILGEWPPRPTL